MPVWNVDKSIECRPALTSAGEFLSAVSFLPIIASHSSGPPLSISCSSLVLFVFLLWGTYWGWLHAAGTPAQRLWTLPVHGLAHASCTWASSRFQPSPLFPVTPQSLSQVSLSSELSQYFFPQTESLFILSLFTCPYILRVLVLKLLICLFIWFARSFSCSMTPVIKLQHLFFPCDSDSKPSACPSECSCSFRRAFFPQPSLGSIFSHKLIYRQVWESSRF